MATHEEPDMTGIAEQQKTDAVVAERRTDQVATPAVPPRRALDLDAVPGLVRS